MENVQNVFVTAEVSEMLNYQAVHVIRTAKELLGQGLITENDFRSAGLRTYLFNEEAIKQLRIKFNCPTSFLTWTNDEKPYQIESIRYSELRVVGEDLIILNNDEEKEQFQALNASFHEEENEEEYEEFINEKEFLHEMVQSDDSYGWISYVKLEKAIREGKAYFINDLDLIQVQATDLERMTVASESAIISEIVTQVSDGIFKSKSGDYYRFTGTGQEVEEIDTDDYRMKYWQMNIEDALEQIKEDFELDCSYEKVSYWDNQPIFLTKNKKKIDIKEVVVNDGNAILNYRNLSDILDDIKRLVD